ncbi:5247_t:CDS:2 [Paraglomus occultum]|uniref:5247_t:CDS:1 n=1 Tax=Paraglomus occultum TaxID=144539 RepID=A0A9N8VH18_9GLOM|nr:5247_t:CDS:2 [Paraglomus occultum]
MSGVREEADTQPHLAIGLPMTNEIESTTIVVSPEGNYVATFHKDVVRVWSLSEKTPEKKKETWEGNAYQGLAVSDHEYLAVGNVVISFGEKEDPSLEPELKNLRSSSTTSNTYGLTKETCASGFSNFHYAFFRSREFVVVNDVGVHRYETCENRWEGKTTEFDWPFPAEDAFSRRAPHKPVRYSITNGKLICVCSNYLTQWDLDNEKKEMEYYIGSDSTRQREHGEEDYVIAIDSRSTLSALVTKDDDAQTLTVYWIQTGLPMSTIRVKNNTDDWIVAMEFIETWDYLLLLTVTKEGKAMLWYPYNLERGTPLDTINLQEYVDQTEWRVKRTFVISRAKIIVNTDDIPEVICAVEDRIKTLNKNRFNHPPSATPIRHLSLKKDYSYSTISVNGIEADLEATDPFGASLRWTTDSGLCVYKNSLSSPVTSINAQEFKYFGKVTHAKILDNGYLAILTVRCLCIFYLSEKDTIELSYYWDNGMRPSSVLNYLYELTDISLDEQMDDSRSNLFYAKLNYNDDTPLPLPSFKSIWWHKRKALETNHLLRKKLFENLINLLITEDNLARYGNILLAEAIEQRDEDVVESIMKTCIGCFHNNSIQYIGFLQLVTDSLPELCVHYPDKAAIYFSNICLILAPQCRSVNSLMLPFNRICAFPCRTGNPCGLIKRSKLAGMLGIMNVFERYSLKGAWRIAWQLALQLAQIVLRSNTSLARLLLKSSALSASISQIDNMIESFWYRARLGKRRSTLTLVVRLPNFCSYPQQFSIVKDYLLPAPSPFVKTVISRAPELFRTWDGEALINFKWRAFGFYYYILVCMIFIAFAVCFITAISLIDDNSNNNMKQNLFIATVVLAVWHLHLEVRQFIWNPIYYVLSVWNWFGFAHALFVLLKPEPGSSWETPSSPDNNDPNDPWKLTTTLATTLDNGTIVNGTSLVVKPDENTNVYTWFNTSLLGAYKFLVGDWSSVANWGPNDNPLLVVMTVLFSFFVVIYLMNLFIGLLNNAINTYHEYASYLAQKAEVLAEIELFYLTPSQRRSEWFPSTVHFETDTKELRKVLRENIQADPEYPSKLSKHSKKMLEILSINE